MLDLRPFQIILLGLFFAFAIGGLIMFAVFRGFPGDPNPYGARVEIWGTLDTRAFSTRIDALTDINEDFGVVTYTEKDPRTFRDELVNAVAEGRGPDAIVLPDTLIASERAKFYPIPYSQLSERDFRDLYIDGAEIFARTDGIYGYPFAVDPLVMYWNRDLFANEGFAEPPRTWEQITGSIVPALTRTADVPRFTVTQSALAFGEYTNVTHAKDVLLLLMLQAGSPLIEEGERTYRIAINERPADAVQPPAEAALSFYTQFANPNSPTYTWNRSLQQDWNAFLGGKLALYFGFGSEYRYVAEGNPNLNFDAAAVPQGGAGNITRNFGRFYSIIPLRSSDNLNGTIAALATLTSTESAAALVDALALAPVHRSTITAGDPDPFRQRMYTAAISARSFLDPNPQGSENVFKTMIEDVTSGRLTVEAAVADAAARLNQLLR